MKHLRDRDPHLKDQDLHLKDQDPQMMETGPARSAGMDLSALATFMFRGKQRSTNKNVTTHNYDLSDIRVYTICF